MRLGLSPQRHNGTMGIRSGVSLPRRINPEFQHKDTKGIEFGVSTQRHKDTKGIQPGVSLQRHNVNRIRSLNTKAQRHERNPTRSFNTKAQRHEEGREEESGKGNAECKLQITECRMLRIRIVELLCALAAGFRVCGICEICGQVRIRVCVIGVIGGFDSTSRA